MDENDNNRYLDTTLAYRRASLQAIEYLGTLGYTGEQAYLLLSAAPIEARYFGVVALDTPTGCVGYVVRDSQWRKSGKLKRPTSTISRSRGILK